MMDWLHKFTLALGAYGPWGLFVLCLVDSLGVPLPVMLDGMVIAFAAASVKDPRHAYFVALLATVGSLAGNLGLYIAARRGASWLSRREPPPGKRRAFREWFQRYGLLTVFVPAVVPFLPLPLKVFVITAAALKTPSGKFIAVIVLARVIRYFGQAYLGLALGAEAEGYLSSHGWGLAGGALAAAIAAYLAIRVIERRREAA